MKNIFVLLPVLILGLTKVDAQTFQPVYEARFPQIIPPSPQSRIFEQYINHKITEYNGLPEISIPLHEIRINGLTIPIALTYHAGGIRFGQYDGEVGAGWSIGACGYRVSRSVNNKPDEATNFYNPAEITAWEENGDSKQLDKLLSGICDLGTEYQVNQHPYAPYPGPGWDQDGEYDLFTYSAPTTSSRFIISDRSNKSSLQTSILGSSLDQIQIINTNSISWMRGNTITDIAITDGQGVKYNYGGYDEQNQPLTERSGQGDTRYGRINTAWVLKQIQTPYNGEVKFSYEAFWAVTDPALPYQLNICDAFHEFSRHPGSVNVYTSTGVFIPRKLVDQEMQFVTCIESENERVRFVRYGKTNPYEYPYLIKEIEVTSKSDNRTVKKIVFNYEVYCGHKLLASMDICYPDTGKPVETHRFDYFRLEPGCEFKYVLPDQWGYHKYFPGSSRTDIVHEEFGNDEYIDAYDGGSFLRIGKLERDFRGYLSNRSENGSFNGMYNFLSLKQISFPTGGTTQYEYEPNEYYDYYKNKKITGGGQRIRKITSDPGENGVPVITEFKYGINENRLGIPNFFLDYQAFADETYICMRYPAYIVYTGSGSSLTFADIGVFTRRIYSENPVGDAGQGEFSVTYPQVTIYQYNTAQKSYNGKTVSLYDKNEIYLAERDLYYPGIVYDNLHSNWRSPLNVVRYAFSREPKLLKRIVYDSEGAKLEQEEYAYQTLRSEFFEGMKTRQKIFFNGYGDGYLCEDLELTDKLGQLYQYHHYVYANEVILPVKKTITEYYRNGADSVKTTETYSYNHKYQLSQTSRNNGVNGDLIKTCLYPPDIAHYDSSPAIYTDMVAKNMVAPMIEQITINNNKEVGRIKTNYFKDPVKTQGLILPEKLQTSASGESNLHTEIVYDLYDAKGNIRQVTTKDGTSTVYLWSYAGLYPVAEIKNATYEQIKNILSEALINRIAVALSPDKTDMQAINNLRQNTLLSNTLISTYTYLPPVGMLTATDPTGRLLRYDYDSMGRLTAIRNESNNIVEMYQYNYKH